uniref:Uncharacterized protein n=1 Tax=Arundo donax TaxID=35708 RepID=A0A0A9FR89_ARUDO
MQLSIFTHLRRTGKYRTLGTRHATPCIIWVNG